VGGVFIDHAYLLFLAQPSGNLVQHHHAEGHPPGHLRQRQKNLLPKSNTSSIATMQRPDPSPGRPRPIQSWKKSSDYVNVFPGHNTRIGLRKDLLGSIRPQECDYENDTKERILKTAAVQGSVPVSTTVARPVRRVLAITYAGKCESQVIGRS